jgi:tetratricopeptide (TPR) repeat protein
MDEAFGAMFDAARRDRNEGQRDEAERGYALAADRARAVGEPLPLAHALRHVSDLARERGAADQALQAAKEAVALYRSAPDLRPLDLANALRLEGLALTATGRGSEAMPVWQEARALYESVGVTAGVDEADRELSGLV